MVSVTEPPYYGLLKSLVKGIPEAFFIQAGAMRYDESSGEYATGWFDTLDENSVRSVGTALPAGGRDRVLAAVEMHRIFPEAYLVAMSKTRDRRKPTYASITQKELLQKGVDHRRIVLQQISVDTITEIKEAVRITIGRGWRNVVFITGEWHVSRAEALLNHIEDFANKGEGKLLSSFAEAIKKGTLQVQFLHTTRVLSAISETYKRFFEEEITINPGMQARITAEAEGMRQIVTGTYGGRMLTHKIWPEKP